MKTKKPNWKDYALFENVGTNLIAMQGTAQKLGIKLTRADYQEMERIAVEAADLFAQIKAACLAGDKREALRLGRILCELPPKDD